MDKYKGALIKNASKLDAVTDSCGKITQLATSIVDENSKEARYQIQPLEVSCNTEKHCNR